MSTGDEIDQIVELIDAICDASEYGACASRDDILKAIKGGIKIGEGRSKARIDALEDSAQTACEMPPSGCECAGCSYAMQYWAARKEVP